MNTERSEAEEKLGELIRDAIDHSGIELDLFKRMDHPPIPSPETFMAGKPDYPHRRWIPYAMKAAVFIIAVLICSTAMVGITERAPAAAKPAELNITTGELSVTGESVVLKRYSYSDESKFALAKERAEGLLSPTYVPEGYAFQSLYIDIYSDGNWLAHFVYTDGKGIPLKVKMKKTEEDLYKVAFDDADNSERLSLDRHLYYVDDKKNGKHTATCILGKHYQIIVDGNLDQPQMKKIVEGMK